MAKSKVTEEQQYEIRARRRAGEGLSALAREYGLAVSRVHAICNNGALSLPKHLRPRPGRPKAAKLPRRDEPGDQARFLLLEAEWEDGELTRYDLTTDLSCL
jgi:hypothetical protein